MDKKAKVWIVDDERIIRITLADDLRDAGFRVKEFADPIAVLTALREEIPDIVITDLKMPNLDGIELLHKIKEFDNNIQVIVMTAHGSIENAVDAMKLGAYDYILKPFQTEEIFLVIDRICELRSVKRENKELRKQIDQKFDFSTYIGESETNKEVFNLIQLIAEKDSTVLIIGETGTGKEHITNIIHYNSQRRNKPLVKVSCAILSREIFESELFGHVKGAFTGADQDKKGRFEMADGGTLYLDDIDDIPLDLQVKLLRVLQESEIEKVGSATTQKIDIRIIASTKKNLRKMVDEGKFREDLYYRLNIFPINLLPLRERKKDIKIVFKHYVQKYLNNPRPVIENEVFNVLEKYQWPGNIRELKNIAERMVIFMSNNPSMKVEHIPIGIRNPINTDINYLLENKTLEETLSEIEVASIKFALEKAKQNKTKAAEILGIPPSTLRTKMDKYGIS